MSVTTTLAPIATENASMNAHVCHSLAAYLRRPASDVVVPRNADKYHDTDARASVDRPLDEVFDLMWRLNVAGLEDATIGTATHREGGLSTTLDQAVASIVEQLAGRSVRYVELGPEPAKTRYVLQGLLSAGVVVESYTAVDINPASEAIMRGQLGDLFASRDLHFVQSLFEELPPLEPEDGTCHLVTMLGFEEGNDHPRAVAALLSNLLCTGDIFLSEMQLLPKYDWSPIYNFYQSEFMRRFSRVTLERTFGDVDSEFGMYLVPVALNPVGVNTMVAVIAETVVDTTSDHYGRLLVTNYCLKYSDEEFRATREAAGDIGVRHQHITGDGSIAFQLSARI